MDIAFFDDQYVLVVKIIIKSMYFKGKYKYFGDILLSVSQINVRDIIFIEGEGYFVLFVNEKDYIKQDLNYLAYIVCKMVWLKYDVDLPYEYCFKKIEQVLDDYIANKECQYYYE